MKDKITFLVFKIVYQDGMSNFYPQIDPRALVALTTLRSLLEADENYLDNPDCPYDPGLREELKKMLTTTVVEVPVEKIVEKIVERRVEVAAKAAEGEGKRGPKETKVAASADVISKELSEVVADLRMLKLNSKTLQPGDKAMILKTQAVLIEKLVTLEERLTNIKRVSRFMSTIMGILDDIMTDEQRQTFMKRLEPFAQEE